MAVPFHNSVKLHGFHQELFHLTFNISGLPATYTQAELIGRALAVDPATPNTLKLADAAETIVARLASFEDRTGQGEGIVGAAEFRFAMRMPIADAQVVAVGDTVVGGGDGFVQAAVAADHSQNFVTEVSGGFATVVKF